jgi:formyl-CoA transferase
MQHRPVRRRQGNHHPTLTPYGLFNGKNGQSIIIAAVGKRVWENLCDAMGHPEFSAIRNSRS